MFKWTEIHSQIQYHLKKIIILTILLAYVIMILLEITIKVIPKYFHHLKNNLISQLHTLISTLLFLSKNSNCGKSKESKSKMDSQIQLKILNRLSQITICLIFNYLSLNLAHRMENLMTWNYVNFTTTQKTEDALISHFYMLLKPAQKLTIKHIVTKEIIASMLTTRLRSYITQTNIKWDSVNIIQMTYRTVSIVFYAHLLIVIEKFR